MLNRIRLSILDIPDLDPSMATHLHDFLLTQGDPVAAKSMMSSPYKPFSQRFYFSRSDQKWIWEVNTLSKEAANQFLAPLEDLKNIPLKNRQKQLTVTGIKRQQPVSYQQLIERVRGKEAPGRKLTLRFYTPSSFKVHNKFQMYPRFALIYESLLERFGHFSPEHKTDEAYLIEQLAKHTELTDFYLRSCRYPIGKAVMKGYTGNMRLKLDGSNNLVQQANLLFAFGNYSGVGIKTCLGMGGMEAEF